MGLGRVGASLGVFRGVRGVVRFGGFGKIWRDFEGWNDFW